MNLNDILSFHNHTSVDPSVSLPEVCLPILFHLLGGFLLVGCCYRGCLCFSGALCDVSYLPGWVELGHRGTVVRKSVGHENITLSSSWKISSWGTDEQLECLLHRANAKLICSFMASPGSDGSSWTNSWTLSLPSHSTEGSPVSGSGQALVDP